MLRSPRQHPGNYSLLSPIISFSTFLSFTVSMCSSFRVIDQIPHTSQFNLNFSLNHTIWRCNAVHFWRTEPMTNKEINNIPQTIIPYIVQGNKNWSLRDRFKHNTWIYTGIKKSWSVLCTWCYITISSRILHVIEMVHHSWLPREIKANSYREISWVTGFTVQGYDKQSNIKVGLQILWPLLNRLRIGSSGMLLY